MAQADSPNTTILCEPVATSADLQLFQRDLRDCFEGCIPLHEALDMIGAPEQYRAQLRADYRLWTRRFGG
jgi:hypothetical protein